MTDVNKINIVKRYIEQFRSYIKSFNKLLMVTYNLDIEPTYNEARTLFPRSGMILDDGVQIDYLYHGSGCTFTKENVIISYDIDVLHNNEIKISDWKFNEFIRTYTKGMSLISIDDLDTIFMKLTERNVLIKRTASLVFNINEDYFLTQKEI